MKLADIEAPACQCGQCVQAGVSDRPLRRDPVTGAWLHGYDLLRWYMAREAFRRRARSAVGVPGRHASGFEQLAMREPWQEG